MGLTLILLQLTASHCRELEFAFKKRKLVCTCCSIRHVAHRQNTMIYVYEHLVTKCIRLVVKRVGDEVSIYLICSPNSRSNRVIQLLKLSLLGRYCSIVLYTDRVERLLKIKLVRICESPVVYINNIS